MRALGRAIVWTRSVWRLVLLVVVLATVLVLAIWLLRPRSVVPGTIRSAVTFAILTPSQRLQRSLTVAEEPYSYDRPAGILTYRFSYQSSKLIMTMQETPESFVDIPESYQKLVDSMQPYLSFESVNGAVSVTRPRELEGKPVAVMNAKGTLVFIRAESDLDDASWKRLFAGLEVVR